eukprot:scaffold55966_cov38-Phaeocystis_antarctica.AAC.1
MPHMQPGGGGGGGDLAAEAATEPPCPSYTPKKELAGRPRSSPSAWLGSGIRAMARARVRSVPASLRAARR